MKKTMQKYVGVCLERAWLLGKWLVLAGVTGVSLGFLGGLFAKSITTVTQIRESVPWMMYLLPVAGIVIVGL